MPTAGLASERTNSLCRDCLAEYPREVTACERCGSERIVSHPELGRLAIAHIDCDAFYAAIEKRDDPSLEDKPVLIGGGTRGVVSTACYIARKYGPRSAMPMFKALKLCPNAIVIKPNIAKYAAASKEVRTIFDSATPIVEPLSLDEAFLDLTGTAVLFNRSPAATLAFVAREIERKVRITVSIGLSYNKFLAKIASDLDKPRGFAVIGKSDAVARLHDMPITRIPGVGPSLADRLKVDGLFKIGDLQAKSEQQLTERYGETGTHLSRLARGQDSRRVNREHKAKSVSSETTFNQDIGDFAELRRRLWLQAERVAERMKAKDLVGQTVALKLKTNRFKLVTRNRRLDAPTNLAETMFAAAEPLLKKEADGRKFRLIGIGLDDISRSDALPAAQADLFAADATAKKPQRTEKVEKAMDAVRAKFGRSAIKKGRAG
ncbi:MAG: DNA polymerase IV [Rhodobacteraceae bacterium]|nr:DNA polymerase IV [Paracoccaceae bacterium]